MQKKNFKFTQNQLNSISNSCTRILANFETVYGCETLKLTFQLFWLKKFIALLKIVQLVIHGLDEKMRLVVFATAEKQLAKNININIPNIVREVANYYVYLWLEKYLKLLISDDNTNKNLKKKLQLN